MSCETVMTTELLGPEGEIGARHDVGDGEQRCRRASSRSVFALRFGPRSARVSAGSARCGVAPASERASQTNNQPVPASTATSTSSPAKRPTHFITASGVEGMRPRVSSPVSRSRASKVICALCTSNPAYDRHRGLLSSSGFANSRESLAPSGGGPSVHAIFARVKGAAPVRRGASLSQATSSANGSRWAPRAGRKSPDDNEGRFLAGAR
jgi:hypothetical protein